MAFDAEPDVSLPPITRPGKDICIGPHAAKPKIRIGAYPVAGLVLYCWYFVRYLSHLMTLVPATSVSLEPLEGFCWPMRNQGYGHKRVIG